MEFLPDGDENPRTRAARQVGFPRKSALNLRSDTFSSCDSGSDGKPTAKPDRKQPKVISPESDLAFRSIVGRDGESQQGVQFGYGLNYLIASNAPIEMRPSLSRR